GYDNFIVTLSGGPPLQNDFLWFLIDTSVANQCTEDQSSAGWDLCGTWQMYGSHGDRNTIGSMDLFAATQSVDNTTQAVPEPSTILLSGVGLLGLALGRKRVIKSKA
ncbi:MAG: PEP-CTERM sorting domain-containing protein, partial [Pseudomonadota bacterium]